MVDLPNLPGALCKGRHELFDQSEDGSYPHKEEAFALCAACPAFDACKRWARRETTGIWAGEAKSEGVPL